MRIDTHLLAVLPRGVLTPGGLGVLPPTALQELLSSLAMEGMIMVDSTEVAPGGTVYLDYNASAPLRPEARAAMLAWLDPIMAANSHSVHRAGQAAAAAVSEARCELAELVGCSPGELVFTSGATEANNLAIHAALAAFPPGAPVVTTAVEHPAVLATVRVHGQRGVSARVVGVDGQGRLDLDEYRDAVRGSEDTGPPALVSVMAANNETGVLSDLAEVVAIAREVGALVHTDATQLVGRLPVDVRELDVDLLSLSAHKFGGPQGVGALYVNRHARLAVHPLHYGGGQEAGWRAGTHNVAGIAGAGAAAFAARRDLGVEPGRVGALRDDLERRLLVALSQVRVNGQGAPRLPGVTSVTIPNVPAEAVIAAMPEVAVSEGSACAAGAPESSHVLLAMGLSREDAASTLRFSLGHATTARDIDRAVLALIQAIRLVADALESSPAADPKQPNDPGHDSGIDQQGVVSARV
jgi:cysteine desulfurase